MTIEGKTVVVTGGAGFIGSHLCRGLLERGASVVSIDDCSTGRTSLVPNPVIFEQANILHEGLSSLLAEHDPYAIVHLAAKHYIPECNKHPYETFRVNVLGTQRLLAAVNELPNLERFVFASSAAIYPAHTEPLEETHPPAPLDIYGQTKLLGEKLVRLFSHETGVSSPIARLFNVYGPGETNPHLIPDILEQAHDKGVKIELGNLTPRRDFVHVEDVVEGLITMLESFQGGVRTFNIGTGETYSVRDVVEILGNVLGEEFVIGQDESRIRESDRPHLEADIQRIKRELDWSPRFSLRDGLKQTVSRSVSPAQSGRQ